MIVVLVNPNCFGNIFSIVSSSFLAFLVGLSNTRFPLEITVLTFANPCFSKNSRSLSFRILGFDGPMPRKRATYLVIFWQIKLRANLLINFLLIISIQKG